MLPYCGYCVRLCLVLEEAGVAYELVQIDASNKRAW